MAFTALSAARLATLLQKIYPRQLAGSWDNTGLLLESAYTRVATAQSSLTKILLCIDLTTSVCDEAINLDGCSHIISYHPIIFSGLKSLTLSNTQQRSLLRLAAAGISVYSPHTSIDAIQGGVNGMLSDCFRSTGEIKTSKCIEPCKVVPPGFEGAGAGRLITLATPIALDSAIAGIKSSLSISHVQVARATNKKDDEMIHTIALCAGSGGSVLKGLAADLIFTGELSHHEQLAFVEAGSHVVLCGHSNTERPFLPSMKRQIEDLCKEEHVQVVVSAADASPFETV
ncbi:protein of unknown function [Taphrina deformans PYCC 5710]|uniref:NGG1 interacting factor Nif3 n=1 Tax=Taphrina deformans (strain PYCC 5710 / ATCC 11124 / CBS 356.35 / IMI 108563 / JCM 9778 / NBRC 8474) TaxID=1097556 RepID=R4XEK8_TAPDE|nr:protein of unknown function [Taphrina deformans PYCC 5710]|eukprot:CCG84282.1 protein of unknown function [Taphrina deformans PYCC 5710]